MSITFFSFLVLSVGSLLIFTYIFSLLSLLGLADEELKEVFQYVSVLTSFAIVAFFAYASNRWETLPSEHTGPIISLLCVLLGTSITTWQSKPKQIILSFLFLLGSLASLVHFSFSGNLGIQEGAQLIFGLGLFLLTFVLMFAPPLRTTKGWFPWNYTLLSIACPLIVMTVFNLNRVPFFNF